jgi:cytochrome c peroxidase
VPVAFTEWGDVELRSGAERKTSVRACADGDCEQAALWSCEEKFGAVAPPHRLIPAACPRSKDRYFGRSKVDMARALASYVRSILAGNSPYDRFVAGDREALTGEQQVGLRLFRGKGNCSACHVGPTFSDERLHNTGVAWRNGRFTDDGGGRGTFKTPTLREVARTAPYMHDGSMTTLQEVVEYYNRSGNANPALDPELRPLRLSVPEKQALVSFLLALSGQIQEGWHSAEPRR